LNADIKVLNNLTLIHLTLKTTVIKFTLTIIVRANQVVIIAQIYIYVAARLLEESRFYNFQLYTGYSNST